MKISTFLLSLSGLFAFYIYYADWIDELIDILSEDYFGIDYEEVAPFIPSDTQGTEEFDSIVEELSNPRAKNIAKYQIVLALISIVTLAVLGRRLLKRAKTKLRENEGKANSFPLTIIGRRQRIIRKNLEDVPVQVIWKGNNLIESSVHCNLKEETSEGKARKEIIHAKPRGGGDEQVTHTSSNESTTVHRLKQARKLLESEHKCMGTDDMSANEPQQLESDVIVDSRARVNSLRFGDKKSDPIAEENPETGKPKEEFGGDPKLMNRIRLLESRLRLEELKNRSWITRMTRAEGILQQLNKQVERGIDSMSKGANSSLLSGGANRTVQTGGSDVDENVKNHEHGDELDAAGTAEEKLPVHPGKAVCPSVSASSATL
ncbi:UNVERIFIED_CONTAM: hypothetical protein PYX00_001320 [Menopon gallinae]|uniref:Uncharacterized protein n=1 Tax=Menopon gallinae TaxID=328185 RepID=A0AAW2IDK6_9NEOP